MLASFACNTEINKNYEKKSENIHRGHIITRYHIPEVFNQLLFVAVLLL